MWGGAPGTWAVALFHLSSFMYWSRRRHSILKLGERCGCRVSTMVLSEARGRYSALEVHQLHGFSQAVSRLSATAIKFPHLETLPARTLDIFATVDFKVTTFVTNEPPI
jgi:hypothetical protein